VVGRQVSEKVFLGEPAAFNLIRKNRNNDRRNTTIAGAERRTLIAIMGMVIGSGM
jgi:hypothetical protein